MKHRGLLGIVSHMLDQTGVISFPMIVFRFRQADRGFTRSQLCTYEDGTILVHTLHCSDWYIKKGGDAPRATDKKSM